MPRPVQAQMNYNAAHGTKVHKSMMILITSDQEYSIHRNNGVIVHPAAFCYAPGKNPRIRQPHMQPLSRTDLSPKPRKPSGYDDSAVLYAESGLTAGQPAILHGTQMVKADRNTAVSKTAGQGKRSSRPQPAASSSSQFREIICSQFCFRLHRRFLLMSCLRYSDRLTPAQNHQLRSDP